MALAFDAVSSTSSSLGSGTTSTHSHTTDGSDRVLFVCCSTHNTTDASRNITGITYAGAALSQAREDNDDAKDGTTEIWYKIAPATGANNIVVTYAGTGNTIIVGGISFTGVDQTTPVDASNGAVGNGTTASVAVVTVTDGAWVIDAMAEKGNRVVTVGADQTERWNLAPSGGITGTGSTEGPKVTAGSVTMSWTWTVVSNNWLITGVAVRPAAAAPPSARRIFTIS